MKNWNKKHCLSLLAALWLTQVSIQAQAGPVAERVRASATLKVCIWPDYYGVTFRHPRTQQLGGIDIELSADLARDLKVKLQYVESSFTRLIGDLKTERCDVAMFAVGVLPQRAAQLSFSQPYLQSDIYGVTTRSSRTVRQWSDIDQPGVVVGVQAGTFMEPVMTQNLKAATVAVVRPPATRERELEGGRIDVFMTDYPYSRRLLDNADWAKLIAPPQPFFVLPYAYAVKQGDAEWLGQIDDFVARIKRDGRLLAAAKRNGLAEIVVN
ncbi:ABC transporter substrate-binding protein [Roseateles toxinivorans]|uniref:Amino acid ABC transporter substrate-binding protein (PAAT family) n=1 Tax=Roseateles toxinivorans TaxID=270368 RepID=A0A4R6QH46_9BURK|nr:ABC transporter substrate-binding protein [Roseateles toxinivorans]TDP62519.1 amino acid ABC transporter substrate-binding protein (PAAT family) [Roseateles toxinivorans]